MDFRTGASTVSKARSSSTERLSSETGSIDAPTVQFRRQIDGDDHISAEVRGTRRSVPVWTSPRRTASGRRPTRVRTRRVAHRTRGAPRRDCPSPSRPRGPSRVRSQWPQTGSGGPRWLGRRESRERRRFSRVPEMRLVPASDRSISPNTRRRLRPRAKLSSASSLPAAAQAPTTSTDRRPGDDVELDPGGGQLPDHTDMRPSTCGATAKRESDPRAGWLRVSKRRRIEGRQHRDDPVPLRVSGGRTSATRRFSSLEMRRKRGRPRPAQRAAPGRSTNAARYGHAPPSPSTRTRITSAS